MNINVPTVSRKQEHIELCVTEDVRFNGKTTGFERYTFVHNALPELNFDEISTIANFLGKRLEIPLLISCMTGGYGDAERINAQLSEAAETCGIAIGVGSQRQALESSEFHASFTAIRRYAPTVPVIGNIGGDCLVGKLPDIRFLTDLIEADAIAVHLNPLQELLQPEGNPRYRGVLDGIELLVKVSNVPVIVKEVGAGISADVCRRLLNLGVSAIDCAGAGGTSWAGVEILRRTKISQNEDESSLMYFREWGIPTADCIEQLAPIKREIPFTLIASGGVTNGIEAAVSFALGADLAGSARPFLQAVMQGGSKELIRKIRQWQLDICRVMFLTGTSAVSNFRSSILKRQ